VAQSLQLEGPVIGAAPVQVVMATGMVEDGKAAVIISTLAIAALGSDSAGAMEMILTVGAGLPPATFGFAATPITDHSGPPKTLANMRELGVQRLIAYCWNDGFRA
jgi:hypothetical protein